MTDWFPISSNVGVLATLSAVCAFFYWLEKATQWRVFNFLPPLIFVYAVPLILSNAGILASKSPAYDVMQNLMLPMMLVLLLLNVNVGGAVRVMGRGVGVMLFGTVGVMVGAPLGLLVVHHWLGPDAWKAYGALSASWVGGTANLAAVGEMVKAPPTEVGLAVLADSVVFAFWLPILLGSKRFADRFGRFTGVDPTRVARMEHVARSQQRETGVAGPRDYLFLLCIAFGATWIADLAANGLPVVDPYLSTSTWRLLLITTIGIGLSYTPLHRIPASQELGMALVLLFFSRMGASAVLSGIAEQAVPFLLGALIMILTHGVFCIVGAKLLRADLHTAVIASAANIGGVATASVVASYHRPVLVPAGVLMALIGYAIGNYTGYLTALLCRLVGQQ
jgi:uncharacterized membrane protein